MVSSASDEQMGVRIWSVYKKCTSLTVSETLICCLVSGTFEKGHSSKTDCEEMETRTMKVTPMLGHLSSMLL